MIFDGSAIGQINLEQRMRLQKCTDCTLTFYMETNLKYRMGYTIPTEQERVDSHSGGVTEVFREAAHTMSAGDESNSVRQVSRKAVVSCRALRERECRHLHKRWQAFILYFCNRFLQINDLKQHTITISEFLFPGTQAWYSLYFCQWRQKIQYNYVVSCIISWSSFLTHVTVRRINFAVVVEME